MKSHPMTAQELQHLLLGNQQTQGNEIQKNQFYQKSVNALDLLYRDRDRSHGYEVDYHPVVFR